jgi:hypothetical protein
MRAAVIASSDDEAGDRGAPGIGSVRIDTGQDESRDSKRFEAFRSSLRNFEAIWRTSKKLEAIRSNADRIRNHVARTILQRRPLALVEPGEGNCREAKEARSRVAVATWRGPDEGVKARTEPGDHQCK